MFRYILQVQIPSPQVFGFLGFRILYQIERSSARSPLTLADNAEGHKVIERKAQADAQEFYLKNQHQQATNSLEANRSTSDYTCFFR